MALRSGSIILLAIAVAQPLLSDPARSTAQRAPELVLAGQVGGSAYAIAVGDRHVYLAAGTRVVTVEVGNIPSGAGALRPIGETESFRDVVSDVVTVNGHLIVAAGDAGIYVVDVTIPSTPMTVGHLLISGSVVALTVVGQTAYVAGGGQGLHVVDIAEWSNPVLLATARPTTMPQWEVSDVAVAGDYAFLADSTRGGPGLRVVDVSDPRHPMLAASLGGSFAALGVAVEGDSCILVGEGFRVVDVRQPTAPVQLSEADWGGGIGVAIADFRAYVVSGHSSGAFTVVDFRNRRAPRVTGLLDADDQAYAVALAWPYAFVARGPSGGASAVSIDNPSSPSVRAFLPMPGSVLGFSILDNVLYLAGWHGVSVLDAGELTRPRFRGQAPAPWDGFRSVAAAGSLIYVGDWTPSLGLAPSVLRIFDASDVTAPRQISLADIKGNVERVWLDGDLAYIADRYYGLRIVDVSRPREAGQIGAYTSEGLRRAVDVALVRSPGRASTHALVAEGNDGIRVIDVTEPSAPRDMGTSVTAPVVAIAVVGGRAAVVGYTDLRILDTSNIAAPTVLGTLHFGALLEEIAATESRAYVGLRGPLGGAVAIVDSADPARMRVLSMESIPGAPFELVLRDGRLCVAAGDGGFQVYEVVDAATPTASATASATAVPPAPSDTPEPTATATAESKRFSIMLALLANGPL